MPSATLPPQTELKDYRIIRLLGQDNLGALYLAEHTLLGQEVVLREFVPAHCAVLSPGTYAFAALPGMESAVQAAYEDFLANLRQWGRLQHSTLPSVQTAFSGPTGTVYAVMPPTAARPLAAVVSSGKVDEKQLKPLLEQALDALDYLNRRNLLPVELTPDCLQVDGAELKLELFGKLRDANQPAAAGGTPGFAPLEQLQGQGAGVTSVVYALGAVFYRAVCGEPPLAAPQRLGKRDAYAPLAGRPELEKRYSAGFLSSIDKALSLWKEDRWSDFAAWQAGLAAPAAAAPVVAGAVAQPGGGLRLGGGGSGLRLGGSGGGLRPAGGGICPPSGMISAGAASPAVLQAEEEVKKPEPEMPEAEDAGVEDAEPQAQRSSRERAQKALLRRGIIERQYVRKLLDAYRANDTYLFSLLLAAGADANTPYAQGTPLLVEAATNGRVKFAAMLLEAGADVNAMNSRRSTALNCAVSENRVAMVKLLLEHGADVNLADEDNLTPYKTTAFTNGEEIIRLLTPHMPDPWIMGDEDDAFSASFQTNDPVCRDLLREYEEQYEARFGITPAMIKVLTRDLMPPGDLEDEWDGVAFGDDARVLRVLVAAGVDVDKRLRDGDTALHQIAASGKSHLLQTLVRLGANPGLRNDAGQLPMDVAKDSVCRNILKVAMDNYETEFAESSAAVAALASRGILRPAYGDKLFDALREDDAEILQLLLAAGVDKELKEGGTGYTPLLRAAEWKAEACVKLLVDAGADVNVSIDTGLRIYSPLYRAVDKKSEEIVRILLAAGADASARIEAGESCDYIIHHAAKWSSAAILDMLLDTGIDADMKGCGGETPLMKAVEAESADNVKALLARHVDVHAEDTDGWKPLMYACWQCNPAVVKQLLEAGADVNITTQIGFTPLIIVCGRMNEKESALQCLDMLLEAGAEINASDKNGKTALLTAAGNSAADAHFICSWLLEHGADIRAVDKDGRNALMFAAQSGGATAYEFLKEDEVGVDVNAVDNAGNTALHYAARNASDSFLILTLLRKGANVAALNNKGEVPSSWYWQNASIHRNGEVRTALGTAETELMVAAYQNNDAAEVRRLAELGLESDYEVKTEAGYMTLLMLAACNDDADTIRLLLEHGASPDTENEAGQVAADFTEDEECLKLLRGAK